MASLDHVRERERADCVTLFAKRPFLLNGSFGCDLTFGACSERDGARALVDRPVALKSVMDGYNPCLFCLPYAATSWSESTRRRPLRVRIARALPSKRSSVAEALSGLGDGAPLVADNVPFADLDGSVTRTSNTFTVSTAAMVDLVFSFSPVFRRCNAMESQLPHGADAPVAPLLELGCLDTLQANPSAAA